MKPWVLQLLVCFLFRLAVARSQSPVPTLPGFPGPLPFKLETGYIGVGENEEIQLVYYFIESEGDPMRDPLLLWLTGGPGCSGLSALIYEIGPLAFDQPQPPFDGSFPSLITNPYSWTKVASIIFIDSPAGTGFSYATKPQAYASSDTQAVQQNYMFLKKWLSSHPAFKKNRLYIAGDSYGGKIAPMVASTIAKVNEAGLEPPMFLQGYIVGNSRTDEDEDEYERLPYAHRMALVSDQHYELAKSNCHGKYVKPDPNNIGCIYALKLVNECLKLINGDHILEPKCKFLSPKSNVSEESRYLMKDDAIDFIQLPQQGTQWCRNNNYVSSYVWAANQTVQEALHIRKATKSEWKRCNMSIPYNFDVKSVFEDHKFLSEKGFQALAYSGDHDFLIPYMSTLKWIRKLNLTVEENWRSWTAGGQLAGYTEKYKNNQAFLTFATVLGAGHTAPEYKPKQCFEMIKRWLSTFPL